MVLKEFIKVQGRVDL